MSLFKMIPLWIRVAVPVVLVAGLLVTGTVGGYRYGKNMTAAKFEKQHQQALEQFDKEKGEIESRRKETSQRLQDALARLEHQKVKIKTKVVHEIETKPIYKECKVPDTGTQLINQTTDELNALRGN